MIIREADNGTPADPAIKAWRESIRVASGTKVAAIKATTTTDELAAYITGTDYPTWPDDPSFSKSVITGGVESAVDVGATVR